MILKSFLSGLQLIICPFVIWYNCHRIFNRITVANVYIMYIGSPKLKSSKIHVLYLVIMEMLAKSQNYF